MIFAKKGVELILIGSLIHEKYGGDEMRNYAIKLLKKDIRRFLTWISPISTPDSAFGDWEQLNYKGAQVYSKQFGEWLRDGIFSMNKGQVEINKASFPGIVQSPEGSLFTCNSGTRIEPAKQMNFSRIAHFYTKYLRAFLWNDYQDPSLIFCDFSARFSWLRALKSELTIILFLT